jgi:exopolysaccharide production protein ExoZ
MITSLQVFRGIAALAVVIHHAVLSTDAFVGVLPPQVDSFLRMGYLGVDFFFVLSGFIIMYAHLDDRPSGLAVRRYAFKRLVRIFPPYLPLSIGMIALYAALPGFSASGGREFSWVSSLLLLPADQPPALSVAWTLVHEMQFYTVFLLFFLSRRLLVAGLLLWGGES